MVRARAERTGDLAGGGPRRRRGLALASLLLAPLLALVPGAPAGAAVSFTSSGTTATLALTGDTGYLALQCSGGTVRAGSDVATPPIACAAITSLVVSGDGGQQTVNASLVTATDFPSLSSITVDLGAGTDSYTESPLPESISMGAGIDYLDIRRGAPNVAAGLGGDPGDHLRVSGGTGRDTIVVAAAGGSPAVALTSVGFQDALGVVTTGVRGVRALTVDGGAGDDELDLSPIGATGHSIDQLTLLGGPGDDVLVAAQRGTTIYGGTGANELRGGAGDDNLYSESRRDVVIGGAGHDRVGDSGVGVLGGRTLVDIGADDHWIGYISGGDAAARVRVGAGGQAVVTTALSRRGRQVVGTPTLVHIFSQYVGERADREVVDVVPSTAWAQRISVSPDAVVDITVPSGVTWTRIGAVGSDIVTYGFSGGYRDIVVQAVPRTFGDPVTPTATHAHGPIADPVRRYAHRVLRDLELRYPTSAQVDALRAQLASGSRTRSQVATSLTATDTYRGLQVDRAFIDVLRRPTDAAGRTYWIGRLRSGLVLRRLRANLYGSDEFFTRFGYGSNQSYVTAAYQHILGRNPDAAGGAYWVSLIESGTPRGTVADRFLNTPEARKVVVESHFLRFADRYPSSAEMATWDAQLASSSSDGELALIRMLAASGAYYSLA